MKSKRERIAAVLASLPPDCGVMPATELDADEKPVEIVEDGRVMRGTSWTTPDDYDDEADELGLLRSMKGSTPTDLPSLPATAEGW